MIPSQALVNLGFSISIIILTVFQPVLSQSNEVSQIERFYHSKCLKNTGRTEAFEKLRTDVFEMYKYLEITFQLLPDQREQFCGTERSNLNHRIKEIENDLKPCLRDEEKFLANFFRNTVEEILHFFCHNHGEYTRRFFSTEGVQCKKAIEDSKNNDLENCLNRIFPPSKNYVTQRELCDDFTVARKCFTQLLDVYCPRSQDFKNLNGVFFDYIAKPCSSCVNIINNFILMGLVLMHILIYR